MELEKLVENRKMRDRRKIDRDERGILSTINLHDDMIIRAWNRIARSKRRENHRPINMEVSSKQEGDTRLYFCDK